MKIVIKLIVFFSTIKNPQATTNPASLQENPHSHYKSRLAIIAASCRGNNNETKQIINQKHKTMKTTVKNVKMIDGDIVIEIVDTIEGRNKQGEADETNLLSAGMVLEFVDALDEMGLLLKALTCNNPSAVALNLYLMGQQIEFERTLLKAGDKNLIGIQVENECFSTKITKIERKPVALLEKQLMKMLEEGKATRVVEKKDVNSFFE